LREREREKERERGPIEKERERREARSERDAGRRERLEAEKKRCLGGRLHGDVLGRLCLDPVDRLYMARHGLVLVLALVRLAAAIGAMIFRGECRMAKGAKESVVVVVVVAVVVGKAASG